MTRADKIDKIVLISILSFVVLLFGGYLAFYWKTVGDASSDCQKRGGKWQVVGADGHGMIWGCQDNEGRRR